MALQIDWTDFAAQVCNEVEIIESGKHYGDWYLPSVHELELIYVNRAIILATALANGGQIFPSYLWSSVESAFNRAYLYDFKFNDIYDLPKSYELSVRAVRAF